jgi:DNA ligase (NAD+)
VLGGEGGLGTGVARAIRVTGGLARSRVVFAGTLASLTREEAEELAREHGARPERSLGPGIDLLVVGRDPGPKLARARALGVHVISERDFLALARRGQEPSVVPHRSGRR